MGLASIPELDLHAWTHRWEIGYDDVSGKWSREQGYNGAFVDRGDVSIGESPTGRLDWIEKEHGYEITYWKLLDNRVLLFVFLNPEIRGTSLGGGNSVGLTFKRVKQYSI